MTVESVKKVKLGNYPTPLEKMENMTKLLGKGELFIKRDDTTGPAFGGNKTRKLEYLMQEAVDTGCTAVMTFGGTQTNHGRTTVGAAVKLGMKPILVLFGGDTGYLSGNLNLDAMMGADIYFVKDTDKMGEVVAGIIAKYEAQGDKVYQVPVGGSNPLGAVGYIMSVKEIMQQMEEQQVKIDKVVCTVGSMGTFAGMILGAKYFNAPFEIIAVPVSPAPKGEKEVDVANFANEVSKTYNMGIEIKPEDVKIAYGPDAEPYSGEEYNKPDPVTREAIITLAKNEGIMLDPTYTGKTFRGFIDMVKEGQYIKEGENALFIHTGGAMALWTKEHLDDMQDQLRANCTTTEI
ncbi:MAG: D-cysteine desulfhydrase family protein [Oscillospiraceae bacterium]|nr:D-cysteine desulfhydrase family protein [Oscillospiraceae bacterium]